jgi:hypothetical protein
MYWDYYYTISEAYEKAFPDNFQIFPVEYLNSYGGCHRILTFAGYHDPIIKEGIHKNKTGK